MKAVNYISILGVLILSSCASRVYTGLEYDDLYYRPTDQPVTVARSQPLRQVPESNLQAKDYYDNVYAADTLVSDEYYTAAKKDSLANININNYNFDSYAGRLRNFYGNYFYPYWRDPFYMGMGGYGYYDPFFYYDDPFLYNSFYSYPYYGGMYNWSYGGYWGGYWGGYYGGYWGGLYGGYYPYYSSNYYYGYGNDMNPITYGRRERQSNYSSSWNRTMLPATSTSRRSGFISEANRNGSPAARSADISSANSGSRRQVPTGSTQVTNRTANVSSANRSQSNTRTEYNNAGRSYTPSYTNPRMSTRPTYNNSRVNSEFNNSRSYSGSESYRSTPSRSSSSSSYRPASSSSQYSMPSRRSVESGSGYNSGSFSSGRSSSYSSGSESRSYSSGSSSSSYSSGSSGGGSSRSSGGGGGGGSSSSRR